MRHAALAFLLMRYLTFPLLPTDGASDGFRLRGGSSPLRSSLTAGLGAGDAAVDGDTAADKGGTAAALRDALV